MRRHEKASSAGSTEGNGKSRGLLRRAFATRGASSDSKGSSAPKAKLALAFGATLALVLAIGVTLASAVVPTLTIEDASSVSYTSALAKGTVDPQGKETNCHFEYVSQAQLNENVGNGFGEFDGAGGTDCNGNPHNGTGAQNVEANLEGLTPSTVYHLRLVASNEDGQSEAVATDTFETEAVAKPTVTVNPVTTFTGTTAHFSGTVNPNAPAGNPAAFKVNWHFQCTPDCPGVNGTVAPTNTAQPAEGNATGLEPNTHYEVSLVAENAGGSESAGPVSFTTEATGPDATTIPAFVLEGGHSALVGGRVNAHNTASTYWVEYGTDINYGTSAPASKDAAAGSSGQDKVVTQEIGGLALGTTYHYRLVAKNAKGEVPGEDMTFKTPVAQPAESCSNAQFRTGPSANLPDCRAYEDVTTLNLLGTAAYSSLVAENGEAALWTTGANLPGFDAGGVRDTYLAKRTSSGWSSTLASPPGRMLRPYYEATLAFATPNLDGRMIWTTLNAINPEDPDPTTYKSVFFDLYRRELDGSFTWVNRGSDMAPAGSDGVQFAGASADALTVFFTDADNRQYEPDAPNGGVYKRSGQTTTVIKDENGAPITNPGLRFAGISANGSVVAIQDSNAAYVYEQDLGHAVRISNTPLGLFDASPIGVSTDGSKFLFVTSQPLVPDDGDSALDIYEYEVSTGDFRRLSGTVAGPGPGNGEANVNLVLVSPDGSAVYFTSTEQLDGSKGVSGAPNLYRAEGGAIHYAVSLTGGELHRPRLTRDGSELLFESSDRLTAYDNAEHTEIYAYDSSDGGTVCVSCRPNGEVPSGDASFGGNANFYGSPPKENADQHGERIFFQSTDAVLPQDINGKGDVYEFDAPSATTSLISTGESPNPSFLAGNSADGRDIFFASVDSLRPNDQNVGTQKLFDARIGGGFPEPPPPAVCEGEGCRGSGSATPADAAPATPSFSGPGNPKPKPSHAKKHKAKKHKHKSHKRHQSKSHKRTANSKGRTGR